MSEASNALNYMIDKRYEQYENLKRISGVITSVLNYARAIVVIDGKEFTMLNKTGEILEEGDSVWVHYWNNVANGYIAIRNGLANISGGLSFANASMFDPVQAEKYQAKNSSILAVYEANDLIMKDRNRKNVFFVSGNPVFRYSYSAIPENTVSIYYDNTSYIIKNLLSFVREIDQSFFSKELWLYSSYRNTTYKAFISSFETLGSKYCSGKYIKVNDEYIRRFLPGLIYDYGTNIAIGSSPFKDYVQLRTQRFADGKRIEHNIVHYVVYDNIDDAADFGMVLIGEPQSYSAYGSYPYGYAQGAIVYKSNNSNGKDYVVEENAVYDESTNNLESYEQKILEVKEGINYVAVYKTYLSFMSENEENFARFVY